MLESIKELISFIWKTKKWWLIPVCVLILIVGLFLIVSYSSPLPVFVYPLV